MNMYLKKEMLYVTDLKLTTFCLMKALVHFSEPQVQLAHFY